MTTTDINTIPDELANAAAVFFASRQMLLTISEDDPMRPVFQEMNDLAAEQFIDLYLDFALRGAADKLERQFLEYMRPNPQYRRATLENATRVFEALLPDEYQWENFDWSTAELA